MACTPNRLLKIALFLGLTPFALVSHAHHDPSDDLNIATPIEIVGRVVSLEFSNTHSVLTLALERANQPDQIWNIEADSSKDLTDSAVNIMTVRKGEWIRVLAYQSLRTPCVDECFAYGLSFTNENGSTYTLSKQISRLLTEYRRRR